MKSLTRIQLCLQILFLSALITLTLCLTPINAQANTGSGQLSIGSSVPYGSYETNWMDFDGTTAFCIQPSRVTPSSGQFMWSSSVDALQQSAFSNYMYYGYGGPGFSRVDSAWPTLNYRGEPMSDEDYYACTHVLLSDAFSSNGTEALAGLDQEARYWYAWQILGFGANVGLDYNNEQSAGWLFKTRTLPGNWASLSMQAGSTSWSWQERLQYSPEFTLQSDNEEASISFPLPQGITLHNASTGESVNNSTARIAAHETFYFTAPPSLEGLWETEAIEVLGLRDFTPIRIYTGNQSQECTSWKQGMEKGTNTVSFSVRWLGFGDVDLMKTVESESELTPSLQGVSFLLTNKATGEEVIIVTDEQGIASTANLENSIFPHGRLIEGTWILEEASGTPEGYSPMIPIDITITSRQSPLQIVIENKKLFGAVRIIKVDAESKQPILLGGSQGAAFSLYRFDSQTQTFELLKWDVSYPEQITLSELETASDGTLMIPEPLQKGTYKLIETRSPLGYVTENPVELLFEVNDAYNWESPLEIRVENTPKKGHISIAKTDNTTGVPVEGAIYRIVAAEDIMTPDGLRHFSRGDAVGEIMTSTEKVELSEELLFGNYYIKEVSAPTGYAIDQHEYPLSLSNENPTRVFVRESLELTDSPTTLIIEKKERGSNFLLAGARFRIWQNSSEGNLAESFDIERITDESGQIVLTYLKKGTYSIQEIQAPRNYVLNKTMQTFTVDDRGLIDGTEARKLTFENDLALVNLAATHDGASRTALSILFFVCTGALIIFLIALSTNKLRLFRKPPKR